MLALLPAGVLTLLTVVSGVTDEELSCDTLPVSAVGAVAVDADDTAAGVDCGIVLTCGLLASVRVLVVPVWVDAVPVVWAALLLTLVAVSVAADEKVLPATVLVSALVVSEGPLVSY